MNDLIDLVAKAIFEAEKMVLGPDFPHDDRHFKVAIVKYRAMARAAMDTYRGDVRERVMKRRQTKEGE